MANFDSLLNRHPLTIAKIFVTGDYVTEIKHCAKFLLLSTSDIHAM